MRESAKFKNLGHVSVFQLQINAPDTNRATDKKRRDEIRRSKIFDFKAPEYKDFTISQEIKKKEKQEIVVRRELLVATFIFSVQTSQIYESF